MSYKESIRNFYIEFLQGQDASWLVRKYGFDSLLKVNEEGEVYADNPDGRKLIQRMIEIDPTDIVSARISQKEHPEEYPWKLKSPSNPKKKASD